MIKYIAGDATDPIGDGIKLIVHVCNDIGAWGAGFVLAISKKWKGPEQEYKRIPASKRKLGYVQYIPVASNIYVVNMIAQSNIKTNTFGVPPIRYEAVSVCLKKTAEFARSLNNGSNSVSIHMPRIGCGLAGGKWEIMEKIIEEAVGDIPVTVYDYELIPKKSVISFTTSYGSIPKEERREGLFDKEN
jgi:O-acetyl-ADP-ribose deacetylase (regulator of RNase III)